MSDLPKGWKEAELQDLVPSDAPILYGILQPGPDLEDGIPYVRPTEITDDVIQLDGIRRTSKAISKKYKRSVLAAEDIILSMVGTIGKVAIVPPILEGGNITQSAVRIRPNGDVINPRYLAWLLRSPGLRRQYDENRLGTAVPRLNVRDIRTLKAPVPPLPEQALIVARIEELISRLDTGVAALRHAKAQLQRYRQSVLAAAVTGQLTQAWREQHPDTEPAEEQLERILERRHEEWNGRGKYTEPVDHDSSDLKELPESWTWSSFEGVLTELRNGISKKPDATKGLRILRISAVRPLAVDLDDSRFLSDSLSKFATYELEPNDLLFTRYNGTRAFVGVCGLVPILPEPFVYPDKLIRARLVDQIALLPSFVEIAMNAGESRRFLEKRIRTTAGQSGISGGDIKVTPLPIPPLAEQHQIVAEVEARTTAIDHLEAELDRQITRSNRLRQSTLASAFSGRL
jgi:type I restriction enzyme, S subunit